MVSKVPSLLGSGRHGQATLYLLQKHPTMLAVGVLSISYHLLYSINPSLCTDITGCGTCQISIHNIVKHNYHILHIDINTMLTGQAIIIINMYYK